MKILLSILSFVTLFIVTTNICAQETDNEPKKEQNQYREQSKAATMIQTKEQNQVKNQTKTEIKVQTMEQHRVNFVDVDGDGINDNALDNDSEGIPNGKDPDFNRPEDGTGFQQTYQYQNKNGIMHQNNADGSGIGTGSDDGNKKDEDSGSKSSKKGGRK
jgi:hypothetical protein